MQHLKYSILNFEIAILNQTNLVTYKNYSFNLRNEEPQRINFERSVANKATSGLMIP